MDISSILVLLIGLILGGAAIYLILHQREANLEAAKGEMREAFTSLSTEALIKTTDQFLKLANETLRGQIEKGEATLEEKRKLIDANLGKMAAVLEDLREKSTRLSTELSESRKETDKLRTTAEDLRTVLSSSQARGQWGERMVEDILNVVGLIENVNYVKQKQTDSGEKPDFTFFLPKERKVNMDVKFPLTHYERYVSAQSQSERDKERKSFLSDVKGHVKDVASRGYVDPAGGTVDYVLVFIPNESIYAFVHQNDPSLLDFALENHIILCSPITLYAVLSLIHQALSSFSMERKAGQIMALLAEFESQWQKYVESMNRMGKRIDDARKEFETLTTTRTRQLEKPLKKIKEIGSGPPLEESQTDADVDLLAESDSDEDSPP
ncbi:MAG: DNA recombination protein RmuC [Fidelibacterota bacterium]